MFQKFIFSALLMYSFALIANEVKIYPLNSCDSSIVYVDENKIYFHETRLTERDNQILLVTDNLNFLPIVDLYCDESGYYTLEKKSNKPNREENIRILIYSQTENPTNVYLVKSKSDSDSKTTDSFGGSIKGEQNEDENCIFSELYYKHETENKDGSESSSKFDVYGKIDDKGHASGGFEFEISKTY